MIMASKNFLDVGRGPPRAGNIPAKGIVYQGDPLVNDSRADLVLKRKGAIRMRRLIPGAWLMVALAALADGQTFEVASIKVAPAGENGRGPSRIEPTPGNLAMRNVGMGQLIFWAYKIGPARVSNQQLVMGVTH